ncbi:hypothetical protein C8Q76DRAFT_662367 [Earliella scabrosa]|nr:hypothetical protein C8Q76DRAFT_662367 [Earliella scabrosa]
MHLMFENVFKNLMLLWTGNYKGLDTGTEEYELMPSIWDAIGVASAQSGDTIPSSFGPRSPNVASDKTSWTADSRSFWTLYVAPVLLEGRFLHQRYYDHFVRLVKLVHTCLQFEITQEEVGQLREGFARWVQDYERMYYQYEPARLSTCPLTIHALLHIADSIRDAGPVWTSWAFPMERYCGALQPAIRSRRYPYASLNRYILDKARLDHIKLKYSLEDTLAMRPPNLGGFYRAVCIPNYTTCALLPPYRNTTSRTLDQSVKSKIISALNTRFGGSAAATRAALNAARIEEWGRVRVLPDGDTMRAACFAQLDGSTTPMTAHGAERDATYVRYEALVDRNSRRRNAAIQLAPSTFYGQLQHVYVIDCPPIPNTSHVSTERFIFAVVRTCDIEHTHRSLDIHYYTKESTLDVLDITTLQCLVGRIHDRGRWAFIDRSGTLARAYYIGDEDDDGSEDEHAD